MAKAKTTADTTKRKRGRPRKKPEKILDERLTIALHRGEKDYFEALKEEKDLKSISELFRLYVYPALESDPAAQKLRHKRGAPWRNEAPFEAEPVTDSSADKNANTDSSTARTR